MVTPLEFATTSQQLLFGLSFTYDLEQEPEMTPILEAEQRIQSAEQVFELAAKAGRLPSRTEKMSGHDEATRAAIRGSARISRNPTLS